MFINSIIKENWKRYYQVNCKYMKFVVKKKQSPTEKEILEDIELVFKKLRKRSLTIKEYDENGCYSSSTAIRRFGTWNNVLYKLSIPSNNTFYSHSDLMDNIRDVWLKKGEQPARRDMDNPALSVISSGAYLRHLKTWYNALDKFIEYISDTNEDKTNIAINFEENGYKHKTKREPSNRLKVQVLIRDGNKCRYCGAVCNGGIHKIHFDHIIPWAKGGETTLDNLQVLCSDCNAALGDADK